MNAWVGTGEQIKGVTQRFPFVSDYIKYIAKHGKPKMCTVDKRGRVFHHRKQIKPAANEKVVVCHGGMVL